MKSIHINYLTFIFISILIISCSGQKSKTVVIIQSKTQTFAIGDPPVIFKSYGAMLDYFSAGTIVVFKVDQMILKQKGQGGNAYWIDKNLKLNKIETIDTSMANMEIARKYLADKNIMNDENELVEIDLK